jgi:hypothetical protein
MPHFVEEQMFCSYFVDNQKVGILINAKACFDNLLDNETGFCLCAYSNTSSMPPGW